VPQCIYCGKKGFFLYVNSEGICNNCVYKIEFDVKQRVRIIEDSENIITNSKSFKTKFARIELIISHLKELKKYEDLRISTITPAPSEILRKVDDRKNTIIKNEIESLFDKSTQKSDLASTLASKLSPLTKAIEQIRDMQRMTELEITKDTEYELLKKIHYIKLSDFTEKARRAEFKGNLKKALDQYQEALYFLKNDEIANSFQNKDIEEVQSKIKELQQKLEK
jgi:hypothetical protein